MATVLIQPGLGNSGDLHWQSLWESMLPFTKRIEQKNWDKPLCEDWINEIENTVANTKHKEIFIVAHSLGCIAVANWTLTTSRKVSGVLFVAPPDVDILEKKQLAYGFSPVANQKLPFKSILIASSNDDYASIETAEKYARSWGSWFINIGNKGHINADSRIGFWPQGLDFLYSLTNKKKILSYV